MKHDLCTILFGILGRVMNGEQAPEGFLHEGILYEVTHVSMSYMGQYTHRIECWDKSKPNEPVIDRPETVAWIEVGSK
jgi:hypothetical protein